jgi:hypothetical protein
MGAGEIPPPTSFGVFPMLLEMHESVSILLGIAVLVVNFYVYFKLTK